MPSLINRVPPGLLSLLGIKSLGQNPTELPDSVQATIEQLPFYLAAQSGRLNGSTGNITAPGLFSIASLQPQPGEFWVVEAAFARTNAVLAAATTLRYCACIHDVSLGVPMGGEDQSIDGVAGEQPGIGWTGVRIVLPGQGIGIWASRCVLGTAPTVRFDARIVRLNI